MTSRFYVGQRTVYPIVMVRKLKRLMIRHSAVEN